MGQHRSIEGVGFGPQPQRTQHLRHEVQPASTAPVSAESLRLGMKALRKLQDVFDPEGGPDQPEADKLGAVVRKHLGPLDDDTFAWLENIAQQDTSNPIAPEVALGYEHRPGTDGGDDLNRTTWQADLGNVPHSAR